MPVAFGLPAWVAGTIEAGSDIVGLASSLVLARSGHRLLTARRELHKAQQRVKGQIDELTNKINDPNTAATELTELKERLIEFEKHRDEFAAADASTGQYEPVDLKEFKLGVTLLSASFVLKLVFHFLTKL